MDWNKVSESYFLQHRDLKMRNILVNSNFKGIELIDWDGVSTVLLLGYDPIPYGLQESEEYNLKLLADVESEKYGDVFLSGEYWSRKATFARLLGLATAWNCARFMRQLFELLQDADWEEVPICRGMVMEKS